VKKLWVEIRELLALFYRFRCPGEELVIVECQTTGNAQRGNKPRRKQSISTEPPRMTDRSAIELQYNVSPGIA